MFKSKSWLLPARCFITLTPKQQYFLFFFFNVLGCNYYHSDITVFDLALLSVSSLECRFPVGRALPILFPLLSPACVGGGIPHASLPLPAFSWRQNGPPSRSRVLACVLPDGFHGARLCFHRLPGTASDCKAPFIVTRLCPSVFVPLPFLLCF